MQRRWRVAWITGASSGIGRALAVELAADGVMVAASARRTGELDGLARDAAGAAPFPVDVTDAAAMARVSRAIEERLGPIDLAVFNAGIGQRLGLSDFDAGRAAQTMAVNYQGLVNGVAAVLPAMRQRRSGHIALMASLAGYRGLPRGLDYCPSKAAAIALGESLRHETMPAGLDVSVINPGFIETPMMAGADHPLPYLMSSAEASRRIIRGLEKRRFEIAFPWQMALLARIGRMLPYRIYFWLSREHGL